MNIFYVCEYNIDSIPPFSSDCSAVRVGWERKHSSKSVACYSDVADVRRQDKGFSNPTCSDSSGGNARPNPDGPSIDGKCLFSLFTGGSTNSRPRRYSPEQPWARATAAATSLILGMIWRGVVLLSVDSDENYATMAQQWWSRWLVTNQRINKSDGASVDESS